MDMNAPEPEARFTVTLPLSLKRRIERLVPQDQRSRFAVSALERALADIAKQQALDALDAVEPVSARESSVELVRGLRKECGDDPSRDADCR